MKLGRLERLILSSLSGNEPLYIRDCLRDPFTQSEYVAMMRAGHLLERRGLVRLGRKRPGKRQLFAVRNDTNDNPATH